MKNDFELKEDVINEIRWEPSINNAEIEVEVEDGVVMLRGNVDTLVEKRATEWAAGWVPGVKAVSEEIKVRLLDSSNQLDENIARSAANALDWNISEHDRIKVQVQDGWITLSGEVEWWYQKEAAGDAVGSLLGVRAVSNDIIVMPTVLPLGVNISNNGTQNNEATNAQRISLEKRGSKVILDGRR